MSLINLVGADLAETTRLLEEFLGLAATADTQMAASMDGVLKSVEDTGPAVGNGVTAVNQMAEKLTASDQTLQSDATTVAATGKKLTVDLTTRVDETSTKQQATVAAVEHATAQAGSNLASQAAFEQDAARILTQFSQAVQAAADQGRQQLDGARTMVDHQSQAVAAQSKNVQQRGADVDRVANQVVKFSDEASSTVLPQVSAQVSQLLQSEAQPALRGGLNDAGQRLEAALQGLAGDVNKGVSNATTDMMSVAKPAFDDLNNQKQSIGTEAQQQTQPALDTLAQQLQTAAGKLDASAATAEKLAGLFPPVENAAKSLEQVLGGQ